MGDNQGNIQRTHGELHQVTPVQDENGNVVAHHVKPLQLELSVKDIRDAACVHERHGH